MSPPIISVENLSKRYVVGHRKERGEHYNYVALRDVMAQEIRNAARKAIDVFHGRQVVQGDTLEEFWALRDVNFEVRQGEVLGIIGRNGAGKSTLLKLLSRITEPTTGRITLRGRVASLLEVGTGFHPELTGRENIYLNGAILGMNRAEIRKKFDAIVSFAEIERFLDTPVKRYSSGMYVRLAFAVAAHLEPEILVVDEVLAVGDAEFQKKCLGKMDEVSRRDGRTELQVLLECVREGDAVIVTRIDRLARSIRDLQNIVHELREKGVTLKATEQPIDTGTAAGKAFLDMLGVFAEFETNLRRERQLEGIQKAKAECVYKGRKPSIDVAHVRDLRASGMGPAAIAKELKMARSSVYRVLGER